MTGPFLAAMLVAAAVAQAVSPTMWAQLTVRRTIVKVPALPRPRIAPAKPIKWKEGKAPRCIPMRALAGAAITARDSVDLVLRGGGRVRAKLERSCGGLDFYRGFYVKPSADGKICADRETIHDRSGAQCEITVFRLLTPIKER